MPQDRLGAEYAAVICRKAFTCCDAAELAGDAPDEATCRAGIGAEASGTVASYQAATDAGRLIYHGDRARRCLDTLQALPCAQWGGDEELRRFPDCLHIFEGTVAAGGACEHSAECDDGFCDVASGTGICVAFSRMGESCTAGRCLPELACASDASGFPTVCANPLPDGSPCSYDSDCASTFCEASVCGLPLMCNGV